MHESLFKKSCRPTVWNFFWKRFLCTCFPASFAKYFRAPFLKNTSGWLVLQNILLFVTSTSATKCYHWPCFFCFTLNIFRAILLFSECPRQLAMTEKDTKKDAITGVFLWIGFVNTIFFGSFQSSIRLDMFYKVGLLKNFEKLTGKPLCRSVFFLIKLHTIKPATLLKRDFSEDILLWIF